MGNDAMGCDKCGADRGECIHTRPQCDYGCTATGRHYDCIVPRKVRGKKDGVPMTCPKCGESVGGMGLCLPCFNEDERRAKGLSKSVVQTMKKHRFFSAHLGYDFWSANCSECGQEEKHPNHTRSVKADAAKV